MLPKKALSRLKRIPFAPFRLGVILALLWGLAGCHRETLIPQTDEAATWEASGTIRAAEIRVASELGGRIVEVPVGLGDEVGPGDVIARLDATPYTLQLGPAEAEVDKAKAELAALRAGPRPEEIAAARAAAALAEAQRDGAREAWQQAEDVLAQPQSLEAEIISARTNIALAVQGVELAEAQLVQQQLARDQTPAGTPERAAADAEVRASEAALAAAQADEGTARALLSHLLAIEAEPLGLIAQAHAAEGQYRVQAEAVAVAEAKLEDLLAGPTAEEIAVAEAAVRVAETKAAHHRIQVEKCTVRRPLQMREGAAVVIAQALHVGEIAAPAATILTLADLSDVTLDVYAPEPRIGHVMLGMEVEVRVDSFPDEVFVGRVVRIADEPEFTPRNIATAEGRRNTFYAVEVRLDNDAGLLKPGMPADATFPSVAEP
ncbi:MAG: HlyD family secretion protein [Anaerolineales bacterium]